jgi:hypothetical protein
MSPVEPKPIQIGLTPTLPYPICAPSSFDSAMAFMGEPYEGGDLVFMYARSRAAVDRRRSEMLVEGRTARGYFYLPHGTAATLQAELLRQTAEPAPA